MHFICYLFFLSSNNNNKEQEQEWRERMVKKEKTCRTRMCTWRKERTELRIECICCAMQRSFFTEQILEYSLTRSYLGLAAFVLVVSLFFLCDVADTQQGHVLIEKSLDRYREEVKAPDSWYLLWSMSYKCFVCVCARKKHNMSFYKVFSNIKQGIFCFFCFTHIYVYMTHITHMHGAHYYY